MVLLASGPACTFAETIRPEDVVEQGGSDTEPDLGVVVMMQEMIFAEIPDPAVTRAAVMCLKIEILVEEISKGQSRV